MPTTPAEAALLSATAASAMGPADRTVGISESVSTVLSRLRASGGDLYAVEPDGRLRGRIRAEDLAGVAEADLAGVAVAGDLAAPAPWVLGAATLAEAIAILDASGGEEIPVVDSAGRVSGILTRRTVMDRLRRDVDE
jgi:CBS domain-containing protein